MAASSTDDLLVSVVMPVYNCSKYIGAALESILRQSFSAFELIIINDGSKDDSLDKIRLAIGRDSRCTVINQANQGIGAALNHGVALSRGEFVARMDGDDIAYPERLQQQYIWLQENPGIIAVGAQVRLIDVTGCPINDQIMLPLSHEGIDRWSLERGGGAISHPTLFLRTRDLRRMGGYTTGHAEDFDLLLRLAEMGRLANMPDVLLDYRIHDNQYSSAYNTNLGRGIVTALRAAGERRRIRINHLLAKHYRKLAWQETDRGSRWRGATYAVRSCYSEFWSGQSWRSLGRSMAKAFFPRQSQTDR
jgi:glycosyltransferase involved in cell wall biosynthesis